MSSFDYRKSRRIEAHKRFRGGIAVSDKAQKTEGQDRNSNEGDVIGMKGQ
jgi:hypothetical protein